MEAADRWADQLSKVAEVDGYLCRGQRSDGSPVKDLNDLLASSECLDGCLDFVKEAKCQLK